MRAGRRLGTVVTALALSLAACRGAAPPLPPIPPSAGSVLRPPSAPTPLPAIVGGQTVVDRVVVVVNDEPVLLSELQEAVLLYQRETGERPADAAGLEALQRRVLQRLVDRRLQLQEARRQRVPVTEEEVQAEVEAFVRRNGGDRARLEEQLRAQGLSWEVVRRELRDQLMVQKLRTRRLARRTSVTEAEVEAYVAANRAKLEAGLRFRPRHIAILAEPATDPAAWARARELAEALQARLRDGADFAELARAHSADGSAAAGGDLGWLHRGEIQPQFEAEILKLAPGQVTPPIRSEVGYHLFRLEEREEVTAEMLAGLRQQARDILLQQKAEERLEEWLEELRRRALIVERLGSY